MVGHPGIFESERHGGIAIRTERCDERCFDLVVLFEGYLVIAGVTVKEGEEFIATGGVYNLVYPRQIEGVFRAVVALNFKDKTRYTLYVSQGSQISHIATNKGNINRQCLNT